MNAMEHGNRYSPALQVAIQLFAMPDSVRVRITDHGGGRPIPASTEPDLDAKLAGRQSPRGWGLFLIRNMVDSMETASDEEHHTVDFTIRRRSAETGDEALDASQESRDE
jgi:anti-sigma regulatory factor (Ser/Thr protein kinase)